MTKSASIRRTRSADLARIFFAAAILAPLVALGQTHRLTLKDCVDIALGRSPDLRAADLEIRAASETVTAARASLLPTLYGTATAQAISGQATNAFSLLNIIDVQDNGPNSRTSTRGLVGFGAVTLNYDLFKNGSVFGFNDAPVVGVARAQKSVLVWTRALDREQIIFIVATSFLDVATRAERIRLDARRVELCEQRLPYIQQQVEIGLKLQTDIDFAKEQLASGQEMMRLSKAQNVAAQLHLAGLIGVNPDTLVVSSKLPAPPALPPTDKLVANALAKHPGVGVESAMIDQRFNTYRLARAQLYPQVTFSSSSLYGADLTASSDQHLYSGALVVSVPIFDFGVLRANKRAAEDKYLAEKIRLQKVGDDIRRAILDAYGTLVVLQETAALYKRNAIRADTAFQVARSQSRQGLVPPLAAIDAELLLIDDQEALNDQREKELQQFATLQNAAGGTWAWIR